MPKKVPSVFDRICISIYIYMILHYDKLCIYIYVIAYILYAVLLYGFPQFGFESFVQSRAMHSSQSSSNHSMV